MAKNTSEYICQECGAVHSKWSGQCAACGAWNTLSEEAIDGSAPKGLSRGKGRRLNFVELAGQSEGPERRISNIGEFDRVTGGGLVPGSALLIGGDPGIGKSTLLLQAMCALAGNFNTAYVSGEEAIDQVRMRAKRLGIADAPVDLAAATNVRDILESMKRGATDGNGPMDIIVIDSIQTMYVDSLDSAPGTVSQVRACAQELIRTAKTIGACVLLVGHVTKEGNIAGPRVLEHMVDTVLYFEGDAGHQFRILRAVKNRFGPTNEIGVFEMTEKGLMEVTNPSELFLAQRQENVTGSAVLAGMEGTRPVLVEIQALVSQSQYGTPRRAVIGWDQNRLAMVMAVLESRCGLQIGSMDVYLNIAGGLKIQEPAADLSVAAAVVSSILDRPVPKDTVLFGEIGLSGEIRSVQHFETRLKEAEKLGFKQAVVPQPIKRQAEKTTLGEMEIYPIAHVQEMLDFMEEQPRTGGVVSTAA